MMLSLPDDWNYSIAGLVKLSKDGKDSVMSALAELEAFGYLTRDRIKDNKGKFSGVEYNIYEEPQLDFPVAEEQNAEEQNEGKQIAEKPRQLNTNKLNTKRINNTNKLNTNSNIEIFEEILSSVVNVEIRNLYVDYIEMRKHIGAPMTKRGLKMLIDRCERLSNFNIRVQKLLLETAIINNWKNVYMPKEEEVKEVNKEVLDELRSFYLGEEE